MNESISATAIEQTICDRATVKVMSETDLPVREVRAEVERLIAAAGWAPFHRPCDAIHQSSNELSAIEPWRMYALDACACRRLRQRLPPENAGKLPTMLSAADALIQVTWLPNRASEVARPSGIPQANSPLFDATIENMEHIAATAAAIQNLLLVATSMGIRNYWSSGGALREPQVFHWLNIPADQILLGSVFLFGPPHDSAVAVGSKLREKRSKHKLWMRWIELPPDSP